VLADTRRMFGIADMRAGFLPSRFCIDSFCVLNWAMKQESPSPSQA